ncbi:hypothetical protein STHU_55060 [Allostella humosa]|uniref:hypothetical protein n=1 Tax=Stella humosa TaxID=94 RepID=UPI000F4C28D6|nr:hypothetical protein [Stella humosa]BBK34872.1 hypothetical protein STHU_55060 [Stella humosa]
MASVYATQLAACRTDNEINRLHIALDTVITPREFEAVAGEMGNGGPPPVTAWIERTRRAMLVSGLPTQPYARRSIAGQFWLYFHPDRGPAGRDLIIAFAGDAHRLMLPTPIFLQHCRAETFDLLLLRDPARSYYLKGVEGIADDFPGLLAAVDGLVDRARYRRVLALGCSGGGLPAIWTAIAMDLARGISIGGTSPTLTDDPRLATRGISFAPLETLIASRQGALPDMVVAFGADCANDRRKAEALATVLPVRFDIVPGVDRHNLVAELLQRGELRAFLDRILAIDAPPAAA